MLYKLLFTVFLIAADRLSKYLAAGYLMGHGRITVIPGILGLRYIENTGAAFSILSERTSFLIIITVVALAFIAYEFLIKNKGTKFEIFCFILIFSGGIGNLIDRIFAGYVVDYFEFLFMNFAVFNLADVYITVGMFLYAAYTVYYEFFKKEKQ